MGSAAKNISDQHAVTALAIGVDMVAMTLLLECLPSVQFRELPMDISKLLKAENERDPDLIFCGRLDSGVDLVDLATGIRSVYPEAPCTTFAPNARVLTSKRSVETASMIPSCYQWIRALSGACSG
ncbi:MAG: hypothetical protein HC883_03565 [Bdellovibrionaceae bacterium]|nr:hypothetical protein [Pseudobdellovibrionaceae bacterium]